MKKTIVAGVAASAVLAAMPVLGVFAEDITTQTDTVVVTIDPTCTFKTENGISHANGNGTAGPGTWSGQTLSGKLTAGTSTDDYGSTSMTVVCNNSDGWEVTAKTTALSGATSGKSIAWNAAHSDSVSGVSWSVSQAADNGLAIPEGKQGSADGASVAKLENKTTGNAGKTFKVTYGVGIADGQDADTYTGSILYTLAEL